MKLIKFLSSKELKPIFEFVKSHFGCSFVPEDAWVKNDDRLYVVSRDVEKIDLSLLRINSLGLYVGEWRHEELRLSIEGSQLFGPHAKKNVIDLSAHELLAWLRGEDMQKSGEDGFVIVRYGTDYVGCGKIKEGKLLNFVPKIRRLMVAHPIGDVASLLTS